METMMAIKKHKDHVYIKPYIPQTPDTTIWADEGDMRDMIEIELSYIDKKEIEIALWKYMNSEDQYITDMH